MQSSQSKVNKNRRLNRDSNILKNNHTAFKFGLTVVRLDFERKISLKTDPLKAD